MNFTYLNTACPRDPYPLSDIGFLIDGSLGYCKLSFMDAYLGYNQIKIGPFDTPKTTFMSNHGKYYYNVMSFNLKNAGSTYHWLMKVVFSHQIGWNLEVYINDMIVKTTEGYNHAVNLEDVLQLVKKYNMRLNPSMCPFRVQEWKLLSFMLTNMGIEAKPYKW